ncbi:DNA cytosine methyltransferase [Gemmata sp. SH-PL17]|uniref:DNA cytosine methyltransferase n=1 Tax=Gemmata sp. SH-PL17 TaxID=1630693 RepID=UPI0009EF119F|nr:DNA cytosine methyltransferase [Gemmata sp. SH-PL17]
MPSKIPVIGLFAGAGGLEIGAHLAGADVRLSVDNDAAACQTLRLNPNFHPGAVLEADVSKLEGKALRAQAGLSARDTCIVIGGPPCQPFSKSSYWTDPGNDSRYRRARAKGEPTPPKPAPITEAKPDTRRTLVQEFLRLIIETDAQAFLFENVVSITHPRNKKVLESFIEDAQAAEFETLLLKVNAVEYGVPQARQRVVVLGLKRGKPEPPEATHMAERGSNLFDLQPPVSAGEALEGLDDERYFEPEEVVKGRYEKELREIPPGQNYKALTAWAGHANPVFEAETRFWTFLLKLSPDLPSWTVQASPGPWVGPFHWTSRRLRTVELAALQTFPADYCFHGKRRDKVRQIGNAVPPLLAQRLIEPLLSALGSARNGTSRRSRKEQPCDV